MVMVHDTTKIVVITVMERLIGCRLPNLTDHETSNAHDFGCDAIAWRKGNPTGLSDAGTMLISTLPDIDSTDSTYA